MPRVEVQYQFGRLNILPQVEEKIDFLQKGFLGGAVDEHRSSNWKFSDIEQLEVEGDQYISGFLVKYQPLSQEEVLDTQAQRLDRELLENAVQGKARFFLHVASMIIAFHPAAPQIGRNSFISRFVHIFHNNHAGFFVSAEIRMVQDEKTLLSALRQFSRISRVVVVLHPSNPKNTERWRVFDERIKSLNAIQYKEEYSAKIERGGAGIQAVGDPEIEGKIAMAQDGYGKASVTGLVDGQIKTIHTGSEPVTTEAPSDESADAAHVASVVHETVKRIAERFE